MLFALILRGIAFEFRFQSPQFRRVWDLAFAGGSRGRGCAGLRSRRFHQRCAGAGWHVCGRNVRFLRCSGTVVRAGLLGGYALLGAGWLMWKTEGATQMFATRDRAAALILTGAMMALVSAWTALTQPEVAERWFAWPQYRLLWRPLPLVDCRPSSCPLAEFLGQVGAAIPSRNRAVPARLRRPGGQPVALCRAVPHHHLERSRRPSDASFIGVGIAIIIPIVLAYQAHAYWVFRGKTRHLDGYGGVAQTVTPQPR